MRLTGDPSGAIYLDGGRITFARASWVPGLAARLHAIRPALAGLGDLSSGRDADDAAVAGFAVQRGYLTAAGLHEVIRSIVVDAFLVLTIPLAMDSPVAAIRFTSTRTYWTETVSPARRRSRARGSAQGGGADGGARPGADHGGGAVRPQGAERGADAGAVGGRLPDRRARVGALTSPRGGARHS